MSISPRIVAKPEIGCVIETLGSGGDASDFNGSCVLFVIHVNVPHLSPFSCDFPYFFCNIQLG
jgi:hypothetical protein